MPGYVNPLPDSKFGNPFLLSCDNNAYTNWQSFKLKIKVPY